RNRPRHGAPGRSFLPLRSRTGPGPFAREHPRAYALRMSLPHRVSRPRRIAATLVALALVIGACVGDDPVLEPGGGPSVGSEDASTSSGDSSNTSSGG